jgi:hypothetical protein
MRTRTYWHCIRSAPISLALALSVSACVSTKPAAEYNGQMDSCMSRLQQDQPAAGDSTRRKSCAKEVGPAPFESPSGVVPAPVH